MNLLIVSHTPHYRRDQSLVGWGPTLREIDHLTQLFERIVHVAPIYDEPAPSSAIPYQSDRVVVRPVKPAGGAGLKAKLGIVANLGSYARVIRDEMRHADVVHVRCPANISLVGCLLLALDRRHRPRWVKYAGNWQPTGREALSYRFQRWWLRKGLTRGMVTVNGNWPDQPPFVRAFRNPCLTDQEVAEAAAVARGKTLGRPVRLLFVGRVEPEKGVGRALEILQGLRQVGIETELDIIGDGPHRAELEAKAQAMGLTGVAHFHGWLPRTALPEFYGRAHIMLLPSGSEGWPKVLSEAMAYGAVPVASAVSCIPEILHATGAGFTVPPQDISRFVATIGELVTQPGRWSHTSLAAIAAASEFRYSDYLTAVRDLLQLPPAVSSAPNFDSLHSTTSAPDAYLQRSHRV